MDDAKSGIPIHISPLFFCLLASLLYRNQYVGAQTVLASLLHECGHLLVMMTRDCIPRRITVGIFGMRIEMQETTAQTYKDMFFIAAGGPLINLLCGFVLWWMGLQVAAIVHITLALLNLLPFTSLDGGRMLYNGLCCFSSTEKAQKIVYVCSLAVVFILGVLGFTVLLYTRVNVSLLAVAVYLSLLLIFKQ